MGRDGYGHHLGLPNKGDKRGHNQENCSSGAKTQDLLLSLLMWIENIGGRDEYNLHLFLPWRMEKGEAMAASHFSYRVGSRSV